MFKQQMIYRETADPPGGGAPPQADPPPAWHAGITDQEVLGHVQTQGWDKLTPHEAVAAAVQAARANAIYNGVPAAELARIPKADADPATIKAFWQKLGAPADATGYDFSTVKQGDQEAPAAFVDRMRKVAAELNLPVATATRLAAEVMDMNQATAVEAAAVQSASLLEAKAKLDASWGANKEANMFVAKQAAAKLGVDANAISALEQVVGYDKVMELFLSVGQKIGEDKFISNQNPAIPGVISQAQAVASKAELMKDTDFTKRFLAGESAAVRQMSALNVLISGEDGQQYRAA